MNDVEFIRLWYVERVINLINGFGPDDELYTEIRSIAGCGIDELPNYREPQAWPHPLDMSFRGKKP
jgi:hypothetical protein